MSMLESLRTWWQVQTGEDDTPFDRDSFAFVGSLLVHLMVMLALGLLPRLVTTRNVVLTVVAPQELEEEEEKLEVPDEVYFSPQESEVVGNNGAVVNATEVAMSAGEVLSEVSDVPSIIETTDADVKVESNVAIEVSSGLTVSNVPVKGAVGAGTTGALGAVDRITHEILLSLEQRKTQVIWLFDQSPSMIRQREQVNARFDKIYEELGVIQAAGNEAFKKHTDKPLLTSVVAFGNNVTLLTPQPIDDVAEIKDKVAKIEWDTTGNEKIFEAIYRSVEQYKGLRIPDEETREPARNLMVVVFTDEVGDDQEGLEKTIMLCRRYTVPVYIVGVPAPFGRPETQVKWVDPDPKFDQTPQWGRVSQGPESFLPERINLSFGNRQNTDAIDSGFGPYSLTRLAYETGGIYFAVHPNRNVQRAVSKDEVEAFSSHLTHFFDPEVMRRYRPDYVTGEEYMRRAKASKARTALLQAAQLSKVDVKSNMDTRFVKRDEASFSTELSKAQQDAAALEPKVNQVYEVLKQGETDREKESVPRWQAGYDLAIGQAMAALSRTAVYNAMLAKAKRGMPFQDPKNNTWVLVAADKADVGSQLEKVAERARFYLKRVIDEHPGTPWALLAKQELETPVGWEWKEEYTAPPPPPGMGGNGNNNNNVPKNDAKKMLEKGPPKRSLPKL